MFSYKNLIRIFNARKKGTKVNVARAVAFLPLFLVLQQHFLLPSPQGCGVGQSPAGKATTPRPGKKEEVVEWLGIGWSPECTNLLPDGTKLHLHGRLGHPG